MLTIKDLQTKQKDASSKVEKDNRGHIVVYTETPTPTVTPALIWSEWSSWSMNKVESSATREVETREGQKRIVGYNMVHYGTQQKIQPYYRMFRDYSIAGNYEQYGARESYGEKHLTKYVTVSQMNSAVTYRPDSKNTISLTYNDEAYGGYQLGTTTAYNFGDDNILWFIESEDYSYVTEYRYRDLISETNETNFAEIREASNENEMILAPTLMDLKALVASGKVKTKSNTNSRLVLPTEHQMLSEPFRASVNNGKTTGSIYIMPRNQSDHGALGTVDVGAEVWVVAQTNDFYFFVTDDEQMGWNGKSFFR